MGRLTERDKHGQGIWVEDSSCSYHFFDINGDMYSIINKLAHYEDLEEQGRLIELDYNHHTRDDLDRCTHRHCNKCDKYRRELQHYKDLEEAGRLIELPCKPDEIVYAVHEDCRMVKVAYASIEHILADVEAGWGIGYTKEEAEAKLKELEGYKDEF